MLKNVQNPHAILQNVLHLTHKSLSHIHVISNSLSHWTCRHVTIHPGVQTHFSRHSIVTSNRWSRFVSPQTYRPDLGIPWPDWPAWTQWPSSHLLPLHHRAWMSHPTHWTSRALYSGTAPSRDKSSWSYGVWMLRGIFIRFMKRFRNNFFFIVSRLM